LNNPLGFLMNNFAALEDDVAAFRGLIADYRALRQRAASVPALAGVTARLAEKEEAARLDFILGDLDGLFRESRDGFARATGIVDTLRNLARDERRDERTEYDLNEGVKSTLVLARNEYKYHSEVNPEYGDIPRVLCAPGQINQVLLNLVVNAAQAIASQKRAGKGTIRVRTFADDEWVCCDVADDGPGIPDGVREKIMEPFFTTKPPGQGTGLGLAICYDIVVTRHGGTLTVDSREGEGAVFHLRLPRKAST
jgi:signal transduction histidine kinase